VKLSCKLTSGLELSEAGLVFINALIDIIFWLDFTTNLGTQTI